MFVFTTGLMNVRGSMAETGLQYFRDMSVVGVQTSEAGAFKEPEH